METTLAEDIMTSDVTAVDVGTPLEAIMEVIEEKNIIRVPVTDKDKD